MTNLAALTFPGTPDEAAQVLAWLQEYAPHVAYRIEGSIDTLDCSVNGHPVSYPVVAWVRDLCPGGLIPQALLRAAVADPEQTS